MFSAIEWCTWYLTSGSHCCLQDRNFSPETGANCWISCRLELAVAWMAICQCKPNDFCKRSVAAIERCWQRSCSSIFPTRCKWLLWQVQVLFSLDPLFWGFFYGIVHFFPFILCCFGHAFLLCYCCQKLGASSWLARLSQCLNSGTRVVSSGKWWWGVGIVISACERPTMQSRHWKFLSG